jgi:hypothetical protein
MPFDLAFHPQALRSKLRGSTNRYKIKLRAAGFRLIDEVRDQKVLVLVLAVSETAMLPIFTLTSADVLTPAGEWLWWSDRASQWIGE